MIHPFLVALDCADVRSLLHCAYEAYSIGNRFFARNWRGHCAPVCRGRAPRCDSLSEAGYEVMLVSGDITDEAQASEIVARVQKTFGFIDVLINNAGIALPTQLVTDTSLADWHRVMDTNVTGMFLVTNVVLAQMVSQKRGAIVNISSMWGVTGGSCEVAYSASKAAVIGYTKALAKEVAPSGIRVNCIAPGFILTDMTRGFSEDVIAGICDETPLLRAGTPEDVASAALFLASEEASFITGQVLCVDGGRCI